ncbi:MAG TPA: hypothetical protein VNS19_06755 [Acidimicrobiales bacterium]|nr:hypothetical protein [Acidimicrobiales bacterium]
MLPAAPVFLPPPPARFGASAFDHLPPAPNAGWPHLPPPPPPGWSRPAGRSSAASTVFLTLGLAALAALAALALGAAAVFVMLLSFGCGCT